jgi:hypothetical protein
VVEGGLLGDLPLTEIIIIWPWRSCSGADGYRLSPNRWAGLRERAGHRHQGQFGTEIARIDLARACAKSIAPVPPPDADADPTAAPETKPAETPPKPSDDPAAARAAARRAAAESQLKLVPPEGTVPRKTEDAPAGETKA